MLLCGLFCARLRYFMPVGCLACRHCRRRAELSSMNRLRASSGEHKKEWRFQNCVTMRWQALYRVFLAFPWQNPRISEPAYSAVTRLNLKPYVAWKPKPAFAMEYVEHRLSNQCRSVFTGKYRKIIVFDLRFRLLKYIWFPNEKKLRDRLHTTLFTWISKIMW